MRISNDMTYRLMTSNIGRNQLQAYLLQQQLASGKRVTLPSDDPGAFEYIQRLHDDAAESAQYARNADSLDHDLLSVDGKLQNLLEVLHRANEVAISSSDGTKSPEDLIASGQEVDELLNTVIDLANSSEQGRYIFAGLRTDTKPYVTTDTNGDGRVDTIAYTGSQEVKQVEVGPGTYVESNIPGTAAAGEGSVFQTATRDIFGTLIRLRDRLLAGQSTSGTTHLQDIEQDTEHVTSVLAQVGAREEKVKLNRALLDDQDKNTQNTLQNVEALDVAKAATDLSRIQTAYQASLRVSSLVLNSQSLVDYI